MIIPFAMISCRRNMIILLKLLKNLEKEINCFILIRMVVVFIAFTIVMVEYAIPSKDIKLIIILGIRQFIQIV